MTQYLGALALLVNDYDEAIAWYTRALGFELVGDTDMGNGKRWVLLAPPGSQETRLLLARAQGEEQTVFDDLYGNGWDLLERKT
jgi:catechol 2,3-dioxygenase-like lactoylglutathione lyase family enzyme